MLTFILDEDMKARIEAFKEERKQAKRDAATDTSTATTVGAEPMDTTPG